MQKEFQLKNMN